MGPAVAAANARSLREHVIQLHIELIIGIGTDQLLGVILPMSNRIARIRLFRIKLHHILGDRIHQIPGDDVAGEWRANPISIGVLMDVKRVEYRLQGAIVVECLRYIALTLRRRTDRYSESNTTPAAPVPSTDKVESSAAIERH